MARQISVSNEVYELLLERKGKKSFSEVIKESLCANTKKTDIMKYAGILKDQKKELDQLKKQIKKPITAEILKLGSMTLLDTSVIIDFIGDKKIVSLVQELLTEEIKTTCITSTKLENQTEKTTTGFHEMKIYPDENSAREAATLYIELQANGKMINQNDVLIAGIALAYGEVLLTRDRKLASIGKDNIKIV